MEIIQRTLTIKVTLELPLEHAYTDNELRELLEITSEYPEIVIVKKQTSKKS